MKNNLIKYLFVGNLLIFLSACHLVSSTNTSINEPITPTSTNETTPLRTIDPSPTQEIATPDRIDEIMTKEPEPVPPTEKIPPIIGEVPAEILDPIIKELAGTTGTPTTDIIVIRAQEVVWNDGSLGCSKPGVLYTQAEVDAYWIVLEVAGKKFDYRATNAGYFFLCENGLPPISPPVTPNS